MLPFAIQEIDLAVLTRACAERWSEGPQLDFKRDLPGKDNRSKDEFLKDVSSMANTDGGDLVYGIEEADGAASQLCPISVESADDAARRLGQMLDSSVEPRISGIQIRPVFGDSGYLLIVRVPSSYDGPHRYMVNGGQRFVSRNNTHTPEMTYDQLRDAFGRRATLLEQANAFIANKGIYALTNNRKYLRSERAHWVIHVVPLAGIAGRINLDIAALHADYKGFVFNSRYALTRSTNRNGLALHESGDPAQANAFVQVYRNGCLEVMCPASTDHYRGRVVPASWLADELQNVLRQYTAKARQLGIAGPGLLGLTLVNADESVLALNEREFTRDGLADESLQLEPLALDEVSDVSEPRGLIRPLLDVVFQSYGVPRCSFYDKDGTWVGW